MSGHIPAGMTLTNSDEGETANQLTDSTSVSQTMTPVVVLIKKPEFKNSNTRRNCHEVLIIPVINWRTIGGEFIPRRFFSNTQENIVDRIEIGHERQVPTGATVFAMLSMLCPSIPTMPMARSGYLTPAEKSRRDERRKTNKLKKKRNKTARASRKRNRKCG